MTWQLSYLRALDVMAERERELEHARLAREARDARKQSSPVRRPSWLPGGRTASARAVRLDPAADPCD